MFWKLMKQRTPGRDGLSSRRGHKAVAAAHAAAKPPRPIRCTEVYDKQHTGDSGQCLLVRDNKRTIEMETFDVEKFILEVEKRPAIWDMSIEDYHDRDLKRKCWEEIVEVIGGTELSVKEKKEMGKSHTFICLQKFNAN